MVPPLLELFVRHHCLRAITQITNSDIGTRSTMGRAISENMASSAGTAFATPWRVKWVALIGLIRLAIRSRLLLGCSSRYPL
jgi:hypothetical protein